MENFESVDVSWLHHSQRDNAVRKANSSDPPPVPPADEPKRKRSGRKSSKSSGSTSTAASSNGHASEISRKLSPSSSSAALPAIPSSSSSTPSDQPSANVESPSNNGGSSAKTPPKQIPSRRNSWISSLSSRFSSGSTPPSLSYMRESAGNSPNAAASKQQSSSQQFPPFNPFGITAFSPKDAEKTAPTSPDPSATAGNSINANSGSPKSPHHPSFFHNALRKLSSASGGGAGKPVPNGAVMPRRVMNVDKKRDRCKVPELEQAKLRRVAFSVDVEIAGTSRPTEAVERRTSDPNKTPASGDASAKTAGEGASKVNDIKDKPVPPTPDASTTDDDSASKKDATRKQEKKKRSEEERKERKEKRRRHAEENGSIPLQVNLDEGSESTATASSSPVIPPRRPQKSGSQRGGGAQDQPTTDPVRIYRRCCQLRESGVLKKIVEQISAPSSALAESPGTVGVLDLTGFCMNLTDIVTFSDWLSIVPVRKLIMQNCGLTDEAVRVILGGLLATRTVEAARLARRRRRRVNSIVKGDGGGATAQKKADIEYNGGVIERLSFKGNHKVGPEGWRHISLFIHMCRSLQAIDLSGIPFPHAPKRQQSVHKTSSPNPSNNGGDVSKPLPPKPLMEISTILGNALSQRFGGNRLEELLLSECSPSAFDVENICDAARNVRLRRLGFANNNLSREGLEHVIRYLKDGHCEGLDLGGNDLHNDIDLLESAINDTLPLSALSLADCSLTPKTLCKLLQSLIALPNFRFIDLSHNHELFSTQPDSLAMLRRLLPQMAALRRIHLADVCLKSEHAIGLADILADCRKLCHINLLENKALEELASASTAEAQEEACALYASLMVAARVSRSLVAIDIDVPTPENNEVVKALASQIVAYSLRNLQQWELKEELSTTTSTEVPVPEVLAHLVGDADAAQDNEADGAPDDDYVISGTGVVKALGICLGNSDAVAEGEGEGADGSGRPQTSASTTSTVTGAGTGAGSGTDSPLRRLSRIPVGTKKPRDMSRDLLNSARKIRLRLQPALVREDIAGNHVNYRRLFFLDVTLQRMIERFEDEFPETRLPDEEQQRRSSEESPEQSEQSTLVAGTATNALSTVGSQDETAPDPYAVRLSRTSSNTSLYSRALTSEEGQVHRLSRQFTHDILPDQEQEQEQEQDTEQDDAAKQTAALANPPLEDAPMTSLRKKLKESRRPQFSLGSDEDDDDDDKDDEDEDDSSNDNDNNSTEGTVSVQKQPESGALDQLLELQERDPEAFSKLKEAEMVALISAGLHEPEQKD